MFGVAIAWSGADAGEPESARQPQEAEEATRGGHGPTQDTSRPGRWVMAKP